MDTFPIVRTNDGMQGQADCIRVSGLFAKAAADNDRNLRALRAG